MEKPYINKGDLFTVPTLSMFNGHFMFLNISNEFILCETNVHLTSVLHVCNIIKLYSVNKGIISNISFGH